MKRLLLTLAVCLAFVNAGAAQQSAADVPATKADIDRYLEVTHAREMMKNMMAVTTKQMHDMVHNQISKDAANLPSDFEPRMNKMMDDMLRDFPMNEMLDAMIPVYQKHWTKGDVDAMVAFYSTPTGQKILKDLPTIMSEAVQAAAPIMQKRMDVMMERVQQEVAQVKKDSKGKLGEKSKATPN
jgi:hypothetical protein